MLSFHNDPSIKEKYLSRVKDHYKKDEIIQGVYWENGKGCAVGCTIHGDSHKKYEEELQIPMILAKLQDKIFEGLPNKISKEFPIKFLSSIEVGVDLSDVWPKFASWLLIDEEFGVIKFAKTEEQKKYIKLIGEYYLNYKNITYLEWKIAAAAAAAADAAADAAAAAVDAAVSAAYAATAAAYYSSYAASVAAAYAVDASYNDSSSYAASASVAAADAAAAAYDDAASTSAREKSYIKQAEKLIELLKEAR